MTEHDKAAREFGKWFAGAWDDGSVWEGNYVTEGLDDTDLLAEALAIHVSAALARVERETIERCAKVCESRPGADAYADDNRPCGPCCDLNSAAIRALAEEKGASREA